MATAPITDKDLMEFYLKRQIPKKLDNAIQEKLQQEIEKQLASQMQNMGINKKMDNFVLENDIKDITINNLKNSLNSYCKNGNFKVGDIVYWKKMLKNRRFPEYNEPGIVVEIFDTPIFDNSIDCSSSSFHEYLSIRVGTLLKDEKTGEYSFVTYLYDGNRFTKDEEI